jgi:hypothetical protein
LIEELEWVITLPKYARRGGQIARPHDERLETANVEIGDLRR